MQFIRERRLNGLPGTAAYAPRVLALTAPSEDARLRIRFRRRDLKREAPDVGGALRPYRAGFARGCTRAKPLRVMPPQLFTPVRYCQVPWTRQRLLSWR